MLSADRSFDSVDDTGELLDAQTSTDNEERHMSVPASGRLCSERCQSMSDYSNTGDTLVVSRNMILIDWGVYVRTVFAPQHTGFYLGHTFLGVAKSCECHVHGLAILHAKPCGLLGTMLRYISRR